MKMLDQGLMEFAKVKELTLTVGSKLIERIKMHSNEKKHLYHTVAELKSQKTSQKSPDEDKV